MVKTVNLKEDSSLRDTKVIPFLLLPRFRRVTDNRPTPKIKRQITVRYGRDISNKLTMFLPEIKLNFITHIKWTLDFIQNNLQVENSKKT